MSIMLPGELDWVLDLLGYDWPNIDEDKLLACAQAWRDFGVAVSNAEAAGSTAANKVTSANSGEAIDRFSDSWGKFTGGIGGDSYLTEAQMAAEVIALAFDAAAFAVIAGKVAVISQLITLAIEVIAAQAAAPFTFGLSELGALGATQATRLIVRELLDKLKTEVVKAATDAAQHATMDAVKKMARDFAKDQIQAAVVDAAKEKATEAGTEVAQNLAQQSIEQHFGARDGYDFGETADILDEKAGEYVDGVRDLADPATQVQALADRPQEVLEEHLGNQGGQNGSQGDPAPADASASASDPSPSTAPAGASASPGNGSDSMRADFG
ncbi:hypothetical protein N566_26050 [Streptomycetaceae bacterium MP113-05]|nr:hypothetical protein N566_26050 [Streptomycetaceae bacterium MP113-05]